MCVEKSNVYKLCPSFENERFLLRLVDPGDCKDLLKVYSDENAVPFFNSDNCGGDDFYYTTGRRMREAIEYWLWEYGRKGFVRWTIIDNLNSQAIGTIELFNRKADDFFTDCGLLRLDLRSDYEEQNFIINILSLILSSTFEMFDCGKIATKAVPAATERIKSLKDIGFALSEEKLIGHDGKAYNNYFVIEKIIATQTTVDSSC